MAYADFTYYTNTYFGTAIAESDFPRLALRASAVIDRITFQRAVLEVTYADKVKMAMCAVAEEIQTQEQSNGADGIVSESQGQYSVSYGANSNRTKANEAKFENAARLWLDGTFLMFAGFASGEYGGSVDTE